MLNLAARLAVTAAAISVAAWLFNGIWVTPTGDSTAKAVATVLVIAAIFTAVNAVVKPILTLVALPLVVVTLGLFLLVINALMLMLTSAITEHTPFGLHVEGFWTAVAGSVVISVVNWLLGVLVPAPDER